MTRRSCAIYGVGISCAALLIVGIALFVPRVFQTLIHNRLKRELKLAEGSRVIESWKNPPADVFMQYFFFNVTNPEVFLAGGKAAVKQMGPYTYKEYRPRENVTYLENGTKLFAPKSFVFVPEMSAGDPEVDVVQTVNIPVVTLMNEIQFYPFLFRTMISFWMKSIGAELFTTRTIHEMLWGYKDPLLSRLHELKPEVEEYFGFMYKKNGTSSHACDEVRLCFHNKMTWWSSNQSNMINGTDGSAFHALLSKQELLHIFAADLCRSIHLGYVEDVEVQGIPAYRFAPPMDVLASPEENPANAGFCVPAGDCLSKGVLKVSACRQGAPVVVSFPHFYQADPQYINAIDGMNPSKEAHETYLDLNPTTGVPVRACKRAQVNILLDRVAGFWYTRHLNKTIFPVMFVNEASFFSLIGGFQPSL